MKLNLRAAAAALALALVAACGGTESTDHNDADVEFAQQMIPHHQQAVMMAQLAGPNRAGPEVRALAGRIDAAQKPEIDEMTDWLEEWGAEEHQMEDHGSDTMSGMMSGADMRTLEGARGAAFDRLFLTQMIEHHRGAIEMARAETRDGKSEEAVDLARTIEKSQTDEIAEMEQLLAG